MITMQHLRTVPAFGRGAGFCSRGARQWFARHDLSWDGFIRDGIAEEILLATGDAYAQAIVAHAHNESGHG